MSAITAKASRKMKKYAVLTREPRCFLGSFDFSWEQRKAKELFVSTADKGYPELPVLSATQDRGMIRRDENSINIFHDKKNEAGYKRVLPGQFVIHLRSFQGGFAHSAIEGITSPAYTVFGFSEPEKHNSEYWKYVFTSKSFIRRLETVTYGIRDGRSISYEEFLTLDFVYPSKAEQTAIARYLDKLSNLITLHQRKCVFLFGFFQAFISMIFTASTFSWEQRKLSEMCGTFEYGLNAAAKEFDGKNKYIRITDIDDASREFLLSDLSSPDICLDGMSKYILSSGDIVFARTGASVGKTYIYRENDGIVYFAGFLIRAKVNQDNDAEFVFQSTLSPSYEKYIRITSQRSGQPGVNAQEYGEYDLFAPSKEEQQRIGHFLRGIDNLITLHQRECISFTARAGRLILTANKKRNTSSWEQRKFSDITFPAGEKNKDNLPLESYSITNEHGFVPQDEKFENGGTMREADKRMYYIVSPNSFAYNPARINVGSIGYQNIGKNVIVSSLYEVFKTSEDVDDRLLWHWFKSPDFQKLIMQLQEGGVRLYFYYDKLCMGEVSLPSLEEQRKIGKLFNTLDNLITLHQRKPFLMKWRTSDANRNQTNRLVL